MERPSSCGPYHPYNSGGCWCHSISPQTQLKGATKDSGRWVVIRSSDPLRMRASKDGPCEYSCPILPSLSPPWERPITPISQHTGHENLKRIQIREFIANLSTETQGDLCKILHLWATVRGGPKGTWIVGPVNYRAPIYPTLYLPCRRPSPHNCQEPVEYHCVQWVVKPIPPGGTLFPS